MATNTMTITVPHAIDKAMVTSAFERLGPDAVMRGHVALHHNVQGSNWDNCFLAMCFGGYGKLHQMMKVLSLAGLDDGDLCASILNLTNHEVWAVTEAFDHCRAEFAILVEEWLELNYVPAPAPQPGVIIGIRDGVRSWEAAYYNQPYPVR
jgi:hypothetical protein